MNFDWDEEKNEANILKHGIDNRRDYGEIRKISIGPINSHICVVVYTDREDNIRIISARRANQRERRRYYEYIEKATNEEP